MRTPTTRRSRRSRLGGLLAVLALAAGSLAWATGSAAAAPGAPSATAECDPAGSILLNPSSSVLTGGQVNVTWNAVNIGACGVSVRMSGPGFNGDEAVSASNSRSVTVAQAAPSTATWTLSVRSRFGETMLDERSVLVTAPPPPNTGVVSGSVAFSGLTRTETRATATDVFFATGASVMTGTNPSLFNIGTDYEAAYQGVNGDLWVVRPDGTGTDTNLGMAAGTSPDITATADGSFTVAFQANTTVLWTYSPAAGGHSTGLPMAPGTSPSATLDSAGVAIAYVDPNGNLSGIDPVLGFGGFGSPVAPGTSPAITYILGSPNSYRIAYQGTDHVIHTVDSSGIRSDLALTAAAGTSPAITTLPTGEIDVATNASDGTVKTASSTGDSTITNTAAAFEPGTSPTIAPNTGDGFIAAWSDPDGKLAFFVSGAGVTVTGLGMVSSPSWAQITALTR